MRPDDGGLTLVVTREGGFAGMTRSGSIDLTALTARADEARELLSKVDFTVSEVAGPASGADRFTYLFSCGTNEGRYPETELTPDLQRLADLALTQD